MDSTEVTSQQMIADAAVLEAACGRHGVGQNRKPADLPGDVCHLVSPIVGRMRMDPNASPHTIERLHLVLALARLAGGITCTCSHVDAAHAMTAPFPCSVTDCPCQRYTAAAQGPSPELIERAIDAAQQANEANEANVRLLVLMSGVTLEQFQAAHPDIARSLAVTATAAVFRALGLKRPPAGVVP